MGFYDAFFGSSQSQYTAYAIITAIIAICLTILLTATDIPISNRLLIIFFVIISLVPSIFLTLFELTCIVTGGTEPNRWWCYAFGWILAAFIIIYCIFIVIISLISLFTYNNAIDNVNNDIKNNKLTIDDSNHYAKTVIIEEEKKKQEIERFYAENANKYQNITENFNEPPKSPYNQPPPSPPPNNMPPPPPPSKAPQIPREYLPNEVATFAVPQPQPPLTPTPMTDIVSKEEPKSVSNFTNYSKFSNLNEDTNAQNDDYFYNFNAFK